MTPRARTCSPTKSRSTASSWGRASSTPNWAPARRAAWASRPSACPSRCSPWWPWSSLLVADQSKTFLVDLFARYYAGFDAVPRDASLREWMLEYVAGGMDRPLYVAAPGALVRWMHKHTPSHVYHSVAEVAEIANGAHVNTGRSILVSDVDCKPGPRPTPANPKARGHGYKDLT